MGLILLEALLALVLAIGLAVDDSIVVLENIYRYIEEGMEPFAASIKGVFKQIDALKNELDRAKQQVGKKATTDRRG